ncbi:SxtJ family membrane protein [Desulfovibrio caledoniensis]
MIDNINQTVIRTVPTSVTSKECGDTGMAMVLIALLIGWFSGIREFHLAAIILLVLNMIWARAYTLVAKAWLGFSHLLGTVMSKVLLFIVFFGVVTPFALLRRMLSHDPMQLKKWKKGTGSVFESRDHTFTKEEIELPY